MPRFCTSLILMMLAGIVSGCESIPSGNLAKLVFSSDNEMRELEEKHRKKYQETRDPEARDWLLGNVVASGMTPTELTRILGDEGERVINDGWIKNRSGHYQIDDQVWKYGPDREGQSVFLVFREGKLANFDPNQFQ